MITRFMLFRFSGFELCASAPKWVYFWIITRHTGRTDIVSTIYARMMWICVQFVYRHARCLPKNKTLTSKQKVFKVPNKMLTWKWSRYVCYVCNVHMYKYKTHACVCTDAGAPLLSNPAVRCALRLRAWIIFLHAHTLQNVFLSARTRQKTWVCVYVTLTLTTTLAKEKKTRTQFAPHLRGVCDMSSRMCAARKEVTRSRICMYIY